MNSLLDNDRDEDIDDRYAARRSSARGQDREITLGTTMILGIFFALAVFAAVFFGFGYSMGAKHAIATSGPVGGTNGGTSFNTFKPAPGSPLNGPATRPGVPDPTTAAFITPAAQPTKAATKVAAADAAVDAPRPSNVPAATLVQPPGKVTATPPTAHPAPITPSQQIAGEFVVQVAALSHQEDAEEEVNALKRLGFDVAIHSEPDKLLHVQIGPFANKADAVAMRQRVLAAGFNAIVK